MWTASDSKSFLALSRIVLLVLLQCFLALLEDDHRVEVVSFPDPHTQQRLDYITATCIANAYQAGDETSVEAPAPGSPLGAFLCPSVAQVRSAPCDALRRGLQLDDAWF